MPWTDIEKNYEQQFSNATIGAPAKKARVALGALIIKERLKTTDEETVEQIIENPYLQYFLGYEHYSDERHFDPSLMVWFRKRFELEELTRIQEELARKLR